MTSCNDIVLPLPGLKEELDIFMEKEIVFICCKIIAEMQFESVCHFKANLLLRNVFNAMQHADGVCIVIACEHGCGFYTVGGEHHG